MDELSSLLVTLQYMNNTRVFSLSFSLGHELNVSVMNI